MRPRSAMSALLVVAALTGSGLVALLTSSPSATAETITLPASGTVTVRGNGNGHGHGMSQYGAKGAALAGLSSAAIVRFYYPGTTLVTLSTSTIRVSLSQAGSYPTIGAGPSGLRVTGITDPLTLTGIKRYRLVPSGTGLALQKLATTVGATWQTVRTGLPAIAKFSSSSDYIRLYLTDGTSTSYRGSVGGVRSGTGVITVNWATLDQYTEGVAPRESPSSWPAAAVHAQAIAARTYGRNAVESHTGAAYDICDTSQCQVYGGMRHYDSAGTVLWTDDPAAITGNSNHVLRYNGATIFAQFSASSGGWTVAGGQPYLIAKADVYDNAASGDPYLGWTDTVRVSDIADYYGLSRATDIRIMARDGNGSWGGRVLSAIVDGVDSVGAAQHVSTTGFGLQNALGVLTNWFTIVPGATPSAPTAVTATPSDGGVVVKWSPPTSPAGTITGYELSFGGHTIATSAAARSAFAGPRINGDPASVQIRARNLAGLGAAATVTATPQAAPQQVHPLAPARLFDTRTPATLVDAQHLYKIDVSGKAGIPATGARGVQIALTILHPTASGILRVHTWGESSTDVAAIAYRYGEMSTVTLTVPLFASRTIAFEPSAGSVELLGDVMAYSADAGDELRATAPTAAALLPTVATGAGVSVPIRSVAGVGSSATAVLLSVNGITSTATGWLRLWPAGTAPTVNQVAIRPGGPNQNVVLVPIGADGSIRVAASASGIGAKLTVVGVVQPATSATGALESFPAVGTADDVTKTTSIDVSATAVGRLVLGTAQIPTTGVQAVVLLVTVQPGATAGSLWIYPSGGTSTQTATLTFSGTRPVTTTVVVRPGADGSIALRTSATTASLAVNAVGYVTT